MVTHKSLPPGKVLWSGWPHGLLTSPQVLDLPPACGRGSFVLSPCAIFLVEFLVAVPPNDLDLVKSVVFDTCIPQDHPRNLQRLALPPAFGRGHFRVHVDSSWGLGTPERAEVLLADPARAILIIELQRVEDLCLLLVVRTQTLIEQLHLTHVDSCIP